MEKTLHTKIKFGQFKSSVDIIIPFCDKYDKVNNLIYSIYKTTGSNPYTICLVDTGSKNKSFIESLKKLPRIKALTAEPDKGYEAGFKATNNPWVVLMTPDCESEHIRWLPEMGELLVRGKDENIRMVGPLTNHVVDGDMRAKASKGEVRSNIVLTDSNLSKHCRMCHRELLNIVGFTDTEKNMVAKSYKQAICGKSWMANFQ